MPLLSIRNFSDELPGEHSRLVVKPLRLVSPERVLRLVLVLQGQTLEALSHVLLIFLF